MIYILYIVAFVTVAVFGNYKSHVIAKVQGDFGLNSSMLQYDTLLYTILYYTILCLHVSLLHPETCIVYSTCCEAHI